MRKYSKYAIFAVSLGLVFTMVSPAEAFYLEVPPLFKTIIKSFQSSDVLAEDTTGQIAPAPVSDSGVTGQTAPISGDEPAVQSAPTYYQTAPSSDGSWGEKIERIHYDANVMEKNVNELNVMFKDQQTQGMPVPGDLQGKIDETRSMLDESRDANSPEDFKKYNVDQLDNNMRQLDDSRRQMMENERRLKDMKRGAKDMNRGLGMFEKQVAKLKKQNAVLPIGLEEALAKVKEAAKNLQNATDPDEAETLMQDLPDSMQILDEYREQLEMLSRWSQTKRQVDRELKRMTRELTKAKNTVARLAKKEIDLSAVYQSFSDAVAKLTMARNEAVSKVGAGEVESAMDILENDFFGQMEDVWEFQRVIMTMSNLGRFTSEFNKGINGAKREIAQFKKKKIDTSALQEIYDQLLAKGAEAKGLLKASPIDEDAIMFVLQDLENIRQEFEDKKGDLTGVEDEMPWEKGVQTIKGVQMPAALNKYITPAAEPPVNQ